jgi:hypothetical protein
MTQFIETRPLLEQFAAGGRATLDYIKKYPATVSALGDMCGDLGFLALAFITGDGISLVQAAGATAALAGQAVILVYGDEQIDPTKENGKLSRFVIGLRQAASQITSRMPIIPHSPCPKAWGFGLLMMNGVGLLAESVPRLIHKLDPTTASQTALGLSITAGLGLLCLASSPAVQIKPTADMTEEMAADKTGKRAEKLAKPGVAILMFGALPSNFLNIFTSQGNTKWAFIALTLAFGISTYAKSLIKLQKQAVPETPGSLRDTMQPVTNTGPS